MATLEAPCEMTVRQRLRFAGLALVVCMSIAYTLLFLMAISSLWGWWVPALTSTAVFVAKFVDTLKERRERGDVLVPVAVIVGYRYFVALTFLSVCINFALGLSLLAKHLLE